MTILITIKNTLYEVRLVVLHKLSIPLFDYLQGYKLNSAQNRLVEKGNITSYEWFQLRAAICYACILLSR